MLHSLRQLPLFAAALLLASCVAQGDTPAQKRESIDIMAGKVLGKLSDTKPEALDQISKAEGYACFSNVGVSVLFVSGGGGYGVLVDNKDESRHYMQMGQGGVGIGLGVKDFRAVFVFHTREALEDFKTNGWSAGAEADAAAKADGKGAQASGAGDIIQGTTVYQFTETGLALRANLTGTKYWSYGELNNAPAPKN
jgi:lipid-binding SYLF domain-containing protein